MKMKDFSSLKSFRDCFGEVTATRLRMHRQNDKTTCFVLVEGESDLAIFEARLLNGATCKIWQLNGRKEVLTAISQTRLGNVPGVIAIVDADFDRLIDNALESDDLFYCDGHDAEIMMSLTNALEEVIRFKADPVKVEAAKAKKSQSIRDILLDMGTPIGAAMLIDFKNGWNLSFKELEYESFIDARNFHCDEDKLSRALVKQKPALCIDPRDFANQIRNKVREIDNPSELCRGHDFCRIFALCFAKGSPREFLTRAKDIEEGLRMVFQRAQFETTELYRKLIDWQGNNSGHPYRVF